MNASESVLIQRVRNGEKALFFDLVRPCERALYVIAQSVLWNSAAAEEVAQESVLKAFKRLGHLRDKDSFKPWLLCIGLKEARMSCRKDRNRPYEAMGAKNDEDEFTPRDFADWREISSAELERKEVRQILRAAFESLAPIERQVFVLRDIEQFSVPEAGKALGITPAAVKTRLRRARLRLRESLAPTFRNY